MPHIAIISGSIRVGRKSPRVALYLRQYIEENKLGTTEILDLAQYQFPVFEERLAYQTNPLPSAIEFSNKIKAADGVILVTPEYNGGYPASVKNMVDLLITEWAHKPVAISTVSGGDFGGSQVITTLQFSLWKIKAWTVPAMFPIPKVQDNFDENGTPKDKAGTDKRAAGFLKELLWCIEAKKRMEV